MKTRFDTGKRQIGNGLLRDARRWKQRLSTVAPWPSLFWFYGSQIVVSCVKNLLNFTCEKLESFEQSTSHFQQSVVVTSSVLRCVLAHVQGTSELLFVDLQGREGEEELLMVKGKDREALEHSVVLGACRSLPYLWLAPWAGKMNQILRCDWLPERGRWSCLARSRLPAVSRNKNFRESHIINPLLTKLARSRWLDIGLVLFLRVYGPDTVLCRVNYAGWIKEYHRTRICPRAWRFLLRRWTRAADHFTCHWQHWSRSFKMCF